MGQKLETASWAENEPGLVMIMILLLLDVPESKLMVIPEISRFLKIVKKCLKCFLTNVSYTQNPEDEMSGSFKNTCHKTISRIDVSINPFAIAITYQMTAK